MIQQLHSLSHYNFETTEDCYYTFTTDSGNDYEVMFLEYNLIEDIPIQVFQFNFYKVLEKQKVNDDANKVRNTLLLIISTFFQEHDRAIVAVCETIDGNQFKRQRLFRRWYNQFGKGIINREEGFFSVDEHTQTYATLYYREDDLMSSELVAGFRELIENNFYFL